MSRERKREESGKIKRKELAQEEDKVEGDMRGASG